jgi:two-component SAPR family response regulator
MKAIIVDDEQDGIRTLQKMLERYCPHVKSGCFLLQCHHR